MSACDDSRAIAFFQYVGLAKNKRLLFHRNEGYGLSSQPKVYGSVYTGDHFCGFRRFDSIGRADNRHIRKSPHRGKILEGLRRGAVRSDRYAAMRAGYLYVAIIITESHPEDPVCIGPKSGERTDKRDEACFAQPGGRTCDILLGYAEIEKSCGKFLLEIFGAGRIFQVAREDYYIPVFPPQLEQRLAETVARSLHFRRHSPLAISSKAFESSSLFGALPCHLGFPSIKETPLPFIVRAAMKVGLSFILPERSKAFMISSKSCPFISRVFNPKSLSFPANGSSFFIWATGPF